MSEQVIQAQNEGITMSDEIVDLIPNEDEGVVQQEEKPAKKKSKKPKAEKESKPEAEPKAEKSGVVAAIKKCLEVATEEEPITKAAIIEYLTEEFPDREPDKMKATVNTQIHTHFKGKGPEVLSKALETGGREKGYWIKTDEAKPAKKKNKKGKKKPVAADKVRHGQEDVLRSPASSKSRPHGIGRRVHR